MADGFQGPLFIVGCRSGTKGFEECWTDILFYPFEWNEVLPAWIRKCIVWRLIQSSHIYGILPGFVDTFYFQNRMSEHGEQIRPDVWYIDAGDFSIANVFEQLIRHDAKFPNLESGEINHLPIWITLNPFEPFTPKPSLFIWLRCERLCFVFGKVVWKKNCVPLSDGTMLYWLNKGRTLKVTLSKFDMKIWLTIQNKPVGCVVSRVESESSGDAITSTLLKIWGYQRTATLLC